MTLIERQSLAPFVLAHSSIMGKLTNHFSEKENYDTQRVFREG
jgi:hypothetical protein